MRQLLKNKLFVTILVVLLILSTYSTGLALTALYRNVTGIGNVDFTDETTITAITVSSPTKIKVTLISNVNTIASQVYTGCNC